MASTCIYLENPLLQHFDKISVQLRVVPTVRMSSITAYGSDVLQHKLKIASTTTHAVQ